MAGWQVLLRIPNSEGCMGRKRQNNETRQKHAQSHLAIAGRKVLESVACQVARGFEMRDWRAAESESLFMGVVCWLARSLACWGEVGGIFLGLGLGVGFSWGIAALDKRQRVLVWSAEMGLHLRWSWRVWQMAACWRGFFGDVLMAGGWRFFFGWVVVCGKAGLSGIFCWDCWFWQTNSAINRSLLSAVVHAKKKSLIFCEKETNYELRIRKVFGN